MASRDNVGTATRLTRFRDQYYEAPTIVGHLPLEPEQSARAGLDADGLQAAKGWNLFTATGEQQGD